MNLSFAKPISQAGTIPAAKWSNPLDGIRAVAALFVLGCHTRAMPGYFGTVGVWLFFTLSAFLLTQSLFASIEASHVARALAFYIRRFFRIFPMLSIYVVIAGIFVEKDRHFIIHNLLHLRGDGHLWTISQELLFYAMVPPLALLVSRLRSTVAAAGALVVAAWLSGIYLTYDVFSLPANGDRDQFYLAPFLVGMAAAYLLPCVRQFILSPRFEKIGANLIALAIAAVATTILAIEAAHSLVVDDYLAYGQVVPLTGLFALIIVWLAESPPNWLSSIFSLKPLRAVGVVGYSFYLWHWIFLTYVPNAWPALLRFVVVGLATFSTAWASFHLVERPGINCGAWLARRVLGMRPANPDRATRSVPPMPILESTTRPLERSPQT